MLRILAGLICFIAFISLFGLPFLGFIILMLLFNALAKYAAGEK
ncbi:hypothetical protein [Acinetobacter populi]|nr:hypothetical protein [Acinetobacter populi]